MKYSVKYMQLLALGMMVAMVLGLSFCPTNGLAQSLFPWQKVSEISAHPTIHSLEPSIIGIGGKVRLRGQNLGNADNSVVVFHPGVIANKIEYHTQNEVVVRVPVGAQEGPVQLVSGVNAPELRVLQTQIQVMEGCETPTAQRQINRLKAQQKTMLLFGRYSSSVHRFVTAAYLQPRLSPPPLTETDGLRFIINRLIVDLNDFLGFDTALQIADRINAELVGHFPITNSYVLDLRTTPQSLSELERVIEQVQKHPGVSEVWKDMVLELKQQPRAFVDADLVDRYRHNYNANLQGRMDAWASDRIQAPSAWNLIERFIGRTNLNSVKVAVLDTGCDQTHPEFTGVALRKVTAITVRVRVAGRVVILPHAAAFREEPYNLGDPDTPYQHGTRVISLIGARNGNVLNVVQGDRGINGLLHNPMPYTIQVYRASDWQETGDWASLTEFLSVINMAAITGASVMNASWGQPHPINPVTSGFRNEVRVALRKLAHQLHQFRDRLLLVVAAGNEADAGSDPEGMRGEITPFEDIDLDGRLTPGEDINGNGILDHGNYVAASLGTLPNVMVVGAIGGPDHGPHFNWARDDQRANFSNWGVSVQIAAPGTDVFAAGGRNAPDGFQIGTAWFARDRTFGTSFATPLVSGSAALLKAIHLNLSPQQIKSLLITTAFKVETQNGRGGLMEWWTLKTGFAVRQLMVDRGIINNNQEWSGVSKVVYEGLRMFEVRRGADGRAEAFADRALPNLAGVWNAQAHNGASVIWIADDRTIKLHRFDTGATNNFTTLTPGHMLESVLEAAPNNLYLFGVRTIDGDCNRRIQAYVGATEVADTGVYNICASGLFGDRDWNNYHLHKGAWHPDNREWSLDYFHSNGRGNTTNEQCRTWWGNHDFPAGVRTFPGCTGTEFRFPAWSPEGRAYAGAVGAGRLEVGYYKYYNGSHRRQLTNGANFENSPILWLNWSPDGSELGVIGNLRLYTVRRDLRHTDDRTPQLLHNNPRTTFSWQW